MVGTYLKKKHTLNLKYILVFPAFIVLQNTSKLKLSSAI